ncbi:hypothetical protein J4772_14025 [Cohnella sp. LGH]|uniref:hypothetical protein n=1 Tax=Cohnella sp. LGH TaxID=1619153 RepID=UPI001ADCD101|nr:hypothetical protein [Cohnella sp. LGH]QTH45427.1 hypothetical protein J4772_14025 [Cohnella sp. LGH]
MFQYRDATDADFPVIASFPQNEDEAFYMYPKSTYPLTAEQLRLAEDCWIGNVIVPPSSRGSGAVEGQVTL